MWVNAMFYTIKVCHSIGSIATLNQQRPVHRPHIQDLVHVLGRMPSNCVILLDLLQPWTSNALSIALIFKIWSIYLAACHKIVSFYSIHCNPKLKTSCPSPSNSRSGPCAWPHAIKLCSSLGSNATLNQQRHVHRPQIQDLVHMFGRMPRNCVTLFDSINPTPAMPCPSPSNPKRNTP